MSKKIIGATVGTPTSPKKIEKEIKPVKTVNGQEPDENGNVNVSGANITIDTELSETSTNPVQNKVITAKIKEIETNVGNIDVLLETI